MTFFPGTYSEEFSDAKLHYSPRRVRVESVTHTTNEPSLSSLWVPDVQVLEFYSNPDDGEYDWDDDEEYRTAQEWFQLQTKELIKNHRWVKLMKIQQNIWYESDYINSHARVRYIDRSAGDSKANQLLTEKMEVKCQYARFTHYWRVSNHDNSNRVSDDFTNIPIGNCAMYPIFKPFASCTLSVRDHEPGKSFGDRAFPVTLADFYIDKISSADCAQPGSYASMREYTSNYMKNY